MTSLRHAGTIAAALTLFASPVLAQTEASPPVAAPIQDQGMRQPDGMGGQNTDAMREMMREMMMEMMPGHPPKDARRSARADRREGERWKEGGRKDRNMRDRHGMRDGRDKFRRAMMHDAGMRIVFAIVDSDGDGALSLAEIQDFHGRIFKAVDENGDGKVEMFEIEAFFHGDQAASGEADDN